MTNKEQFLESVNIRLLKTDSLTRKKHYIRLSEEVIRIADEVCKHLPESEQKEILYYAIWASFEMGFEGGYTMDNERY